jgi:hypothetical protein
MGNLPPIGRRGGVSSQILLVEMFPWESCEGEFLPLRGRKGRRLDSLVGIFSILFTEVRKMDI